MIISQKNITFFWSIFFFTSAFISFPPYHYISNIIVIIMFIISLTKSRSTKFTNTTYFIIFITILSTFNQILLYDSFNWDKDSLTLISTLMIVIAADTLFVRNKIFNLIITNSLPLVILFILGGLAINNGRLNTEYLNPNIRGIFYFGGLSAVLMHISKFHIINIKNILVLISTTSFLIFSGSRKNIVLVALSIIINFISLRGVIKSFKNPFYKLIFLISFLTISIYIIDKSIIVLADRFGENNIISNIQGEDEYSALERVSFIRTAFTIAKEYPLGIGYGNIKEGMKLYGNSIFTITQNPHSLLAEILISTGYLGFIGVLIFIIFIIKQSFKNFKIWYFIPIYLLVSLFSITLLNDKIFWVILVFFEKEIHLRNIKRVNKKKYLSTIN